MTKPKNMCSLGKNEMSEQIYQQAEYAIAKRLHLGRDRGNDWRGMTWDRPVKIEWGDIWITSSDCGLDWDAYPITPQQWQERVETLGLWEKVGMWSFVRYPNPAADVIRYCEQYPVAAGEELHRLREMIKKNETWN